MAKLNLIQRAVATVARKVGLTEAYGLGGRSIFLRGKSQADEAAVYGWRPATGSAFGKARYDYARAVNYCRTLRLKNGMAKTIHEQILGLAIGDGVTVGSKDDKLDEFLQEGHVKPNMLDVDFDRKAYDWFLTDGELGLPMEFAPFGGLTYFSDCVDPLLVSKLKTQKRRNRVVSEVWLGDLTTDIMKFGVVNQIGTVDHPEHLHLEPMPGEAGKMLYFQSLLPGSCRGVPHLYQAADILAEYDWMVYNTAKKAAATARHIWHVIVQGLDEAGLEDQDRNEFIESITPQDDGSATVSDENVEIKPLSFDMGAQADKALDDVAVLRIGRAANHPASWLQVDTANKATAETMADPVERCLLIHQGQVRKIRKTMAETALAVAQQSVPGLAGFTADDIVVEMPLIDKKNLLQLSQFVTLGLGSIEQARANGDIGDDAAGAAARDLLGQLTDVELEAPTEAEQDNRVAGNVTPFKKAQEDLEEAWRAARNK